ncbi:MAG: DUF3854 domain-containing protein [Planctomycetota bacterium]
MSANTITRADTPTATRGNGQPDTIPGLLPHHFAKLHVESGLSIETIQAAGYRSTTDAKEVACLLNWKRPASGLGPFLVIPFRHHDGTRNGFARVRPDNPRSDGDGGIVKYEQPKSKGSRAYFPVGVIPLLADPVAPLGFTEGEIKADCSTQAGCPCVGLPGVWAWQKPRPKDSKKQPQGPRVLIDDLAAIPWKDRLVWITFDTDPRHNPSVNHARAELARVLTEHGAIVVFVDLPPGPRGPDGRHGKMGVDDFIVAYGEDAFHALVEHALAESPQARSLEDYRGDLVKARVDSVGIGAVYLDTSPTGSGKTYADLPAITKAGSSLTLLTAHRNCREVEELYQQFGLDAAAYPPLSEKTCQSFQEATFALECGLSPSQCVCPTCPFWTRCDYTEAMKMAEAALHRIATHARAAHSFENLAQGAAYVAIHEDPAAILRPFAEVARGLERVGEIARAAKDGARDRPDQTLRYFFQRMERAADWLRCELDAAPDTTPLSMPPPAGNPAGVDARLLHAIQSTRIRPSADVLRICRGIAAGELRELVIRVDKTYARGGSTETHRCVCAVWQATLPAGVPVWLSDATADPDEIGAMVTGRQVINATPSGSLAQQHPAVQIPNLDIKGATSPARVVKIVSAVLAAHPEAQRVGLLAHKKHVATLQGTGRKGIALSEACQARIAKIEYFRSGLSRGSNSWCESCDLILVAGTPRVPPPAVKVRLIQAGNPAAAARDGEWGPDWWSGIDATGRRHTIRGLAYCDRDWHAAHQALVRAELIQAVGRGRIVCEVGVPVVVLSNENLGLPIAEIEVDPLPAGAQEAIHALVELTKQNPKGIGQAT